MRIALLSAEYPPCPGGVGDYSRRLAEGLIARGHITWVYTIYDGRWTIHDVNANRTSTMQTVQSGWGWRSWSAVIDTLDRLRPDLLHIQYQTGAYGMHPAINLLPWRLRHLPGRPGITVTAHDLLLPYLFPKAGLLRRWVTRRLLADADAVVVTNAEDYRQVCRDWRLGIENQSLISNLQSPTLIPIGSNIPVAPPDGYERAAWRARLGIAGDAPLVAYFGLIGRSKGLDVLLRALARLPAHFRLLVIGGAATAPADRVYAVEVEGLIDQLGLRQRVIVTGHCDEPDVSAHLLAADLAALPFADGASFRRGSLLAALAHGVPTVTTQPPAEPRTKNQEPANQEQRTKPALPFDRLRNREVEGNQEPTGEDFGSRFSVLGSGEGSQFSVPRLVDGEHVLLMPPGDAAALAEAIERLWGDAALRERLHAGGRSIAAHFSWETIAERHEALYGQIISRSSA